MYNFMTQDEVKSMINRAVRELAPFGNIRFSDGVLDFTATVLDDFIAASIEVENLRQDLIDVRDEMLESAQSEIDNCWDYYNARDEKIRKFDALARAWSIIIGEDKELTFTSGTYGVAFTLRTSGLSVERIKEIWEDCKKNHLGYDGPVSCFFTQMQNGGFKPKMMRIDETFD